MSEKELLAGSGKAVVTDVEVTLRGSFLHGEIRVNGRPFPLDAQGRGGAKLVLPPPRVVVEISTPAPAEFEFTVTINGHARGDRVRVGSGNRIVRRFVFPLADFFPGGFAKAEAFLALDTSAADDGFEAFGADKGENHHKSPVGGLALDAFDADVGKGLDGGTTVADVEVSLTGSFLHGEISVDGHTIALNGDGEGSDTVQLAPPQVDVLLLFDTPAPAEFEFKVTINGRSREGKGKVGSGDGVERRFSFPFSAFGL
jgi:hypothetical protein